MGSPVKPRFIATLHLCFIHELTKIIFPPDECFQGISFLLQIFAFEMKFILVPILLLLMLAQSFSKWIVVMEYNLNKDFIAKNLCINKSRPKMHCNGKCQMMKRLAEEEKQNSSNNTIKIKVHDIVLSDAINKPVLPSTFI